MESMQERQMPFNGITNTSLQSWRPFQDNLLHPLYGLVSRCPLEHPGSVSGHGVAVLSGNASPYL